LIQTKKKELGREIKDETTDALFPRKLLIKTTFLFCLFFSFCPESFPREAMDREMKVEGGLNSISGVVAFNTVPHFGKPR
jgi:hypothetical protein